MKHRLVPFVLSVLLFAYAGSGHAILLSADSAFGADTITQDTDTGLEWLDLTLTRMMSINEVEAQLQAGGTLEGWKWATAAEVTTLWAAANVPAPQSTFAFGSAANDGALALNALLGENLVTADRTFSDGFIRELTFQNLSPRWWSIAATLNAATSGGTSDTILIADFDTPSPRIGSYLVRTTAIAEPTTLALLGAGMLLVWFRKRAAGIVRRLG